jgi:hypothetical protein
MRIKKEQLSVSSVVFDEAAHTYTTPEGLCLMGVTSLMKAQGLSHDYSGIPEETLRKAAERGSLIHKQIEQYDNGVDVFATSEVVAYADLCKANKIKAIASEYLITDNETVASKIDKVLADGSLADIKTTYTLDTEYLSWQLSTYAYLFERQNTGIKVPALYGIHIRGTHAELVQISRRPDEEIEELIACQREGRKFVPKPVKSDDFLPQIIKASDQELLRQKEEEYAKLEHAAKVAKEFLEQLHVKIRDAMIANNITTLKANTFTITLSKPYERTSVDSKALKEMFPKIYQKCSKTTTVAASVKFTLNKQS